MMHPLFNRIRLLVYVAVAIIAAAIFAQNGYASSAAIAALTRSYALLTVDLLYLTLMISPLYAAFPLIPGKALAIRARRALGVSAFFTALLHASLAFFGELQGFPGLPFLSTTYLVAIGLSATALLILFILTVTSFDSVMTRIGGKRWKFIHRFIYLAAFLVLIHALLLGSSFSNPNAQAYRIGFVMLTVLLLLEAIRFDGWLAKQRPQAPRFGIALVLMASTVTYALMAVFAGNTTSAPALSIHAQHGGAVATPGPGGIIPNPVRYNVSLASPTVVEAGTSFDLTFHVTNADTGGRVLYFQKVYEQYAHLIIVDSTLTAFIHLHPKYTDDGFQISMSLAQPGSYHIYLNFEPLGSAEQQFGFSLNATHNGQLVTPLPATAKPEANPTEVINGYHVSLAHEAIWSAAALSQQQQKFSFTLQDGNGRPVTSLEPYLGAFGHLTLIREDTYDYAHVHPFVVSAPKPGDLSGPQVDFYYFPLYSTLKPGVYRLFAEFNPGGKVITADFTILVQD